MRQEVYLVTKDRLRQIESLVCELEEERERFAREARHHKRIEETYGVGCLFGRDALDAARDRLQAIEAECQDERDTVRQWIDSVSDSMTPARAAAAVPGREELGRSAPGGWGTRMRAGRGSWSGNYGRNSRVKRCSFSHGRLTAVFLSVWRAKRLVF